MPAGFALLYSPLSLRGAKRRSNPGVEGDEQSDERLLRLLLAQHREWLAMTGESAETRLCRGFGGVPQSALFYPQEWGPGG